MLNCNRIEFTFIGNLNVRNLERSKYESFLILIPLKFGNGEKNI